MSRNWGRVLTCSKSTLDWKVSLFKSKLIARRLPLHNVDTSILGRFRVSFHIWQSWYKCIGDVSNDLLTAAILDTVLQSHGKLTAAITATFSTGEVTIAAKDVTATATAYSICLLEEDGHEAQQDEGSKDCCLH